MYAFGANLPIVELIFVTGIAALIILLYCLWQLKELRRHLHLHSLSLTMTVEENDPDQVRRLGNARKPKKAKPAPKPPSQ